MKQQVQQGQQGCNGQDLASMLAHTVATDCGLKSQTVTTLKASKVSVGLAGSVMFLAKEPETPNTTKWQRTVIVSWTWFKDYVVVNGGSHDVECQIVYCQDSDVGVKVGGMIPGYEMLAEDFIRDARLLVRDNLNEMLAACHDGLSGWGLTKETYKFV